MIEFSAGWDMLKSMVVAGDDREAEQKTETEKILSEIKQFLLLLPEKFGFNNTGADYNKDNFIRSKVAELKKHLSSEQIQEEFDKLKINYDVGAGKWKK